MKLNVKKIKIAKLTPDNARAIRGGQIADDVLNDNADKSRDGDPRCGKTEPVVD